MMNHLYSNATISVNLYVLARHFEKRFASESDVDSAFEDKRKRTERFIEGFGQPSTSIDKVRHVDYFVHVDSLHKGVKCHYKHNATKHSFQEKTKRRRQQKNKSNITHEFNVDLDENKIQERIDVEGNKLKGNTISEGNHTSNPNINSGEYACKPICMLTCQVSVLNIHF